MDVHTFMISYFKMPYFKKIENHLKVIKINQNLQRLQKRGRLVIRNSFFNIFSLVRRGKKN